MISLRCLICCFLSEVVVLRKGFTFAFFVVKTSWVEISKGSMIQTERHRIEWNSNSTVFVFFDAYLNYLGAFKGALKKERHLSQIFGATQKNLTLYIITLNHPPTSAEFQGHLQSPWVVAAAPNVANGRRRRKNAR